MHLGRTTLSKFLIQQSDRVEGASDLAALLIDVAAAVKAISAMTAKGALGRRLGKAGNSNVHGETQVQARSCSPTTRCCAAANGAAWSPAWLPRNSMSRTRCPDEFTRGRYLLVFDPLDGSSNTDVNVSVGTIFSVLRHDKAEPPTVADYLQPGSKQVAAGYAIYGPATMLVITVGKGTHGFTLDREIGNFILTHPDLQIPADTSEFAINTSNARFWEPPVHRYVSECQAGKTGDRSARLQHALDRLDGGRGAPHPDARRRVHVPQGHQGSRAGPGGCACCTRPTRSAFWSSRPAAAPRPAASGCWTCSPRRCISASR